LQVYDLKNKKGWAVLVNFCYKRA